MTTEPQEDFNNLKTKVDCLIESDINHWKQLGVLLEFCEVLNKRVGDLERVTDVIPKG